MSRISQHSRRVKIAKSLFRSKLRKVVLSAMVVWGAASPVLAGPPTCACTKAGCANAAIDAAPSANMDLNGDGIADVGGGAGAGDAGAGGSSAAPGGEDYYSTDLASSGQTLAPNMIGDLLNNSGYFATEFFDPMTLAFTTVYAPIPVAGGDRRFKMAENTSPVPQDRVYYSMNNFQNAARTVQGRELNVYRHTFGGEKTFLDGLASLELRVPLLQGLNAVQTLDGNPFNDDGVEFGNMTLIPKMIVSEGDLYTLSTGLGINLPTARDASIDADDDFTIANEAVHLSPFLGLLVTPDDMTFFTGYIQADFDAGGNDVIDATGSVGRYNSQSLLYFDVALGRYLFRDYGTRLTGVAPQLELHYTTTMQDTDEVFTAAGTSISNPFNRIDILTLTAGINFEFWNASYLTLGVAVPLSGDFTDPVTGLRPEQPFDTELQVLFNRFF